MPNPDLATILKQYKPLKPKEDPPNKTEIPKNIVLVENKNKVKKTVNLTLEEILENYEATNKKININDLLMPYFKCQELKRYIFLGLGTDNFPKLKYNLTHIRYVTRNDAHAPLNGQDYRDHIHAGGIFLQGGIFIRGQFEPKEDPSEWTYFRLQRTPPFEHTLHARYGDAERPRFVASKYYINLSNYYIFYRYF